MERLTDKRMKGEGFIAVDPKEYKKALKNEKPNVKQIYKRLLEIENILGDEYDPGRLRELVEVDQKKGQPVWVIERDEDGDPADVVECIFVTAVSGVAIVSAYIHGCQDFESILLDKTDETWRNGECDLAAYPLVDCCWSKEAAERALWGAENET